MILARVAFYPIFSNAPLPHLHPLPFPTSRSRPVITMSSQGAEASSSGPKPAPWRNMAGYSLHAAAETEAPPFTLSRASKDVIFGSVAGMVAKVFEHPL